MSLVVFIEYTNPAKEKMSKREQLIDRGLRLAASPLLVAKHQKLVSSLLIGTSSRQRNAHPQKTCLNA